MDFLNCDYVSPFSWLNLQQIFEKKFNQDFNEIPKKLFERMVYLLYLFSLNINSNMKL